MLATNADSYHMEKEEERNETTATGSVAEEEHAVEHVLFQVSECYVYLIPPRRSAASYRADEWNVNEWAWEGTLKVISKEEECVIHLADKSTGDLYARAFLRDGEPHPVESVLDSSRYFVLRVEENLGSKVHKRFWKTYRSWFFGDSDDPQSGRHAFIGIGFRERTEAYDFQAALHDHMKYLNKKKTAQEMEQQYQKSSSVDYSLKEGETLVLQLKNTGSGSIKSKFFEQGLNDLSVEDKSNNKETLSSIKLPPPPPSPLSPVGTTDTAPLQWPSKLSLEESSELKNSKSEETSFKESESEPLGKITEDIADDDFGDFQAAG